MIILCKNVKKRIQEEIRRYPDEETGGIFLGFKLCSIWIVCYVTTSRNAKRSYSTFTIDRQSAEKEIKQISSLFFPTKLLGVWHSHNDAFATSFSKLDEEANRAFAAASPYGAAVSILAVKVNDYEYLLRAFRITNDTSTPEQMIKRCVRID